MLKTNLMANFLGQAWSAAMNLLFIPVYIRYMGVETYALVGIFSVLSTWLCLLDLGMAPSLSREMARYTAGARSVESIRDLLRSIELIAIAIALAILAGIFFSASWLANSWLRVDQLSTNTVSEAISLMAFVVALRFVEDVYRSAMVGLQKQAMLNGLNAFMATIRGIGAIGVLAFLSPSITAFFIWQGLISILNVCLLAWMTYRSLISAERRARFSRAALLGISRFAGGVVGITILSLLLTQIDKVLLSRLLSLKEYGYYMIASVVSGALFTLITPISQAWAPRLTELCAKQDFTALARLFHQGAQLVTVLVGSAACVLFFYSSVVLKLWTSNAEIEQHAVILVSLLSLGNFLNTLLWMPYQTQLAYGWTRLSIYTNAIAVVGFVPAIFWATPRYGAEGAAMLWIMLNIAYLIISVHFMYRRILKSEKWEWYFEDLLIPFSGAFSVTAMFAYLVPIPKGAIHQFSLVVSAGLCAMLVAVLAASRIRPHVLTLLRINLSRLSK